MARFGDDKMSGLQKSAILLIALGPEKSANLFKHLKEEEIEELTLEIANTRSITPQIKEGIIEEFYQLCLAQQYIAEGGIGYAKELLEKALGTEKAMSVIGKLTASLQVKPFEFVRKTDASQLLNFIQDEHPQTIALILSYLSPMQASISPFSASFARWATPNRCCSSAITRPRFLNTVVSESSAWVPIIRSKSPAAMASRVSFFCLGVSAPVSRVTRMPRGANSFLRD